MAKIYTLKRYELKEVGNLIKDKPANEKSDIKAKELAKVKLPKQFNYKEIDIEIIEQPYWTIRANKTLLIVIVKASQNGQPLNVNDGVFEYKNPPIMISDGTFHKFIDKFGREVEMANYVEDLEIALKEIIVGTIRTLNR